jgi:putative peptidoglycan lipid II flippase
VTERRKSAAVTVAAGILGSRVAGVVRESAVAYWFGIGALTDVFQVALRGPNLLQNLLGEGTLSAAFVPVYSRLVDGSRPEDARRFAGAVLGLLTVLVAVLVAVGMACAEPLVAVLAPGFVGDAERVRAGELAFDRYAATVRAVRIVFPMTGLLVLSAWALGVLNSHRRFFVPYAAPILWNAAIVAALAVAAWRVGPVPGGEPAALAALLQAALWGALAGGLLQLAVQLPLALRLLGGLRLSLGRGVAGVREALRAFGPAVAGRGVYQLSAWLDLLLGSLLAAGAIAALRPAIILYTLPVSLFGLSVAASELPELARMRDGERARFGERLAVAIRQSLFLVLPTAIGYLAFGFLLVGALFRRGAFEAPDHWLVTCVLAGYTLGLPATTVSRLLQNAYFAAGDTRTPARVAALRVAVSAAVSIPAMLWLDRLAVARSLDLDEPSALRFGAVGLALGASAGAWVELGSLLRGLGRRHGVATGGRRPLAAMAGIAALATVPAGGVWWLARELPLPVVAVVVVGAYAVAYLAGAKAAGMGELDLWVGRLRKT